MLAGKREKQKKQKQKKKTKTKNKKQKQTNLISWDPKKTKFLHPFTPKTIWGET